MIINSIRNLVRTSTTYAFRERAGELFNEARLSRIHRKSFKRAKIFQNSTDLKLNLGCGAVIKPGWVNIDLHSENADLRLDLREPWPFSDESVSVIYSEHFFEHLEYPLEVRRFLSEAWRVLSRGGKFDVSIPNFESAIRGYLDPNAELYRPVPPEVTTRMDHLNYTFRQGREHKYAYDFETLTKVLMQAKFVSVLNRPFDPALDSEYRKGSLCVEATKPFN